MHLGRARAVGLLAGLALALSGCNDDGRTLEPTSATMPATEVPTTAPADDVLGFQLTSPDVVEGARIDPAFTCDGGGRAPQLVVAGVPTAAAELAVAVVDLDAADAVHLVAAGLPGTTAQLDPTQLPPEASIGRTDAGVLGWDPPCPARGDAPHRYEIRAYVAAEPIGLAPGLPGHEAIAVIEAAAIDVARLQFTYAAVG